MFQEEVKIVYTEIEEKLNRKTFRFVLWNHSSRPQIYLDGHLHFEEVDKSTRTEPAVRDADEKIIRC